KGPSGATVAAALSYNSATFTATLQPYALLAALTTYTATVSGARDATGNVMAAPVTWSFTTAAAQASCPCTIWPSTAVPVAADSKDPNSVEVGVKFRTDVNGSIAGIRFYKSSTNTGTHVAHLWSSTGTLMAT